MASHVRTAPPSRCGPATISASEAVQQRRMSARFAAMLAVAMLLAGPAAAAVDDGRLAQLPLTTVPAAGGGDTLAVFYSGDGGWAAADKGMAEALVRAGIPVVGVNSFNYFLVRRTPEGAAADLTLVLRHYLAAWGKSRIVLGGYSFGAGALPLIV